MPLLRRACHLIGVFVSLRPGVCVHQGSRLERPDERYPHSELLLYKNLALSDAGMTQEALDHLEECRDAVSERERLGEKLEGEISRKVLTIN